MINAVSSFSQNNPCKQILIWCIVCCDKNGCGVLLLLLLKFLFCVDFFIAQNLVCIYSYASQMEHFTVEVALFFCWVVFKFNDFQQEPGVCC